MLCVAVRYHSHLCWHCARFSSHCCRQWRWDALQMVEWTGPPPRDQGKCWPLDPSWKLWPHSGRRHTLFSPGLLDTATGQVAEYLRGYKTIYYSAYFKNHTLLLLTTAFYLWWHSLYTYTVTHVCSCTTHLQTPTVACHTIENNKYWCKNMHEKQ